MFDSVLLVFVGLYRLLCELSVAERKKRKILSSSASGRDKIYVTGVSLVSLLLASLGCFLVKSVYGNSTARRWCTFLSICVCELYV